MMAPVALHQLRVINMSVTDKRPHVMMRQRREVNSKRRKYRAANKIVERGGNRRAKGEIQKEWSVPRSFTDSSYRKNIFSFAGDVWSCTVLSIFALSVPSRAEAPRLQPHGDGVRDLLGEDRSGCQKPW